METVTFITTESGDDLILSFAVQALDDLEDIESLILMRTPKYESLLEDGERGVSASFERFDDEDDYLECVEYKKTDEIVLIKTRLHDYELDVRKVAPEELKQMGQILQKMNFDKTFKTTGI